MSNEENILTGALKDFAEKFASNPEVASIIEQAHSGEIDEHIALHRLMEPVMGKPELQQQLLQQAMTSLAPAGEELIESYPHMYEAPSGLPKPDPLYEARLFERLQFDGDAPEHRTGALTHGVMPAVPVAHVGTNPVSLGWSLEQASDAVLAEIKALTERVVSSNEDGETTELVAADSSTALATQPEGYKPGQVASLATTQGPSGSQLIALSKDRQQELAWGSYATTQGRRSAAPTLANMLEDKLRQKGISGVSVGAHGGRMKNSTSDIVAKSAWVISILGTGSLSTNEGFSIMENAASALANELAEGLESKSDLLTIEVCTVDTFEKRQVGWAALLRK